MEKRGGLPIRRNYASQVKGKAAGGLEQQCVFQGESGATLRKRPPYSGRFACSCDLGK
jgi:hypothetical protein